MPAFMAKAWNHSRTNSVSNSPIFGVGNETFQTRKGRPETSMAARISDGVRAAGYTEVDVDPRGYRQGSLNEPLLLRPVS